MDMHYFIMILLLTDAGRPYDGIAGEQNVTVSVPHAVIFIFLAIAGIVFAIICLVFNLKFKLS